MIDPTEMLERAAARYEATDLTLESVMHESRRRRTHQRIRAATLAMVVAVAAIVGLIRTFDRSSVPSPADRVTPSEDPGSPISIQGPPPGVTPVMSIAEVKAHVLELIQRNEWQIGGSIAPARILSITYLEPKERYQARGGGLFLYQRASWAVEFEGTYLGCGSYCSAFPGGAEIFADARFPDMYEGGGSAVGEPCVVPDTGEPPDETPPPLCEPVPPDPSDPIEERIEINPPPAGTDPVMSYEQVESYVLELIAQGEAQAGRALAPAQVREITYVAPGDRFPARGGGFRDSHATWVVRFVGTYMVCSSWCSGHPGGLIQFRDAADPSVSPESTRTDELVCVDPLFRSNAPPSTDELPDC